jgi:acyl-CoA dehydrogenase
MSGLLLSMFVGELNQGFALAIAGLSLGRIYNAGRSVGLGRWALDRAIEYAKTRHTFGSPISECQGTSVALADCAAELYCADAISLDCARRLDENVSVRKELAIVKAFTTETAFRVLDRRMQVRGGMGLVNESKLYDAWREPRTIRIADGSSEISRRTIAGELFRGRSRE